MGGITKKEKISRIRLLRKAMLPSCAPARLPTVTPARLYQPRPLATMVLCPSEKPSSGAHTAPPTSEPAMMPMGMRNALMWYCLIFAQMPSCRPMLMPTRNMSRYSTRSE